MILSIILSEMRVAVYRLWIQCELLYEWFIPRNPQKNSEIFNSNWRATLKNLQEGVVCRIALLLVNKISARRGFWSVFDVPWTSICRSTNQNAKSLAFSSVICCLTWLYFSWWIDVLLNELRAYIQTTLQWWKSLTFIFAVQEAWDFLHSISFWSSIHQILWANWSEILRNKEGLLKWLLGSQRCWLPSRLLHIRSIFFMSNVDYERTAAPQWGIPAGSRVLPVRTWDWRSCSFASCYSRSWKQILTGLQFILGH